LGESIALKLLSNLRRDSFDKSKLWLVSPFRGQLDECQNLAPKRARPGHYGLPNAPPHADHLTAIMEPQTSCRAFTFCRTLTDGRLAPRCMAAYHSIDSNVQEDAVVTLIISNGRRVKVEPAYNGVCWRPLNLGADVGAYWTSPVAAMPKLAMVIMPGWVSAVPALKTRPCIGVAPRPKPHRSNLKAL
jgi:hypothetical protein